MSAFNLWWWILAALLLQLAVFGYLGLWRQWRAYQALRERAAAQGFAVDGFVASQPVAAAVAAWAGHRSFVVERRVPEDAGAQIVSFYLVPHDRAPLPAFLPGQFLTVALDVPVAAGATQPVVRCYSLSDAPHPERYRITVKRAVFPAPGAPPEQSVGLASHYLHDQVAVGDLLRVRAPGGHFYLEPSDAPVVLIGGGIGITPLLSMLNWSLTQQPERELWLFYGVRHQGEWVMHAHLSAMAVQYPNLHLHLCVSEPRTEFAADPAVDAVGPVHVHSGRVDIALLRRLLPLKPYHFYLCGPTAMLQSLVPALEEWGVPQARIHFEAFGPASIPRKSADRAPQAPSELAAGSPALRVSFGISNKQALWESTMGSLLDFAEANGVRVQSGCRAGSCGTCQTPIRSGAVQYTQTPDFDPEPGSCLLCVCIPKTDLTLEA